MDAIKKLRSAYEKLEAAQCCQEDGMQGAYRIIMAAEKELAGAVRAFLATQSPAPPPIVDSGRATGEDEFGVLKASAAAIKGWMKDSERLDWVMRVYSVPGGRDAIDAARAATGAESTPPTGVEGAPNFEPTGIPLLAEKHQGMRVDYSGLLGQCQRGLRGAGGHAANAEMLRQLQGHLKELGQRWYAGDTAVVDEILQLYCIEKEARDALAAQPVAGHQGGEA
ncbi:hypothetical protein C7T35_01160 [Variovorax sp. WS11]|uniref:hypothetical protein n=1 Tax=Variovorax sp. WS11 TaxID=1105204 RepID=UPI000D0E2A0A|nr:hypothetical protein [Variovorax sp. WS11]NDZ11543.1 hypothetical protein [Variovorax sp. WS11]PSL86605.1 hypothetical protein C7T35_01160 [Variovorax sp. WS11]